LGDYYEACNDSANGMAGQIGWRDPEGCLVPDCMPAVVPGAPDKPLSAEKFEP